MHITRGTRGRWAKAATVLCRSLGFWRVARHCWCGPPYTTTAGVGVRRSSGIQGAPVDRSRLANASHNIAIAISLTLRVFTVSEMAGLRIAWHADAINSDLADKGSCPAGRQLGEGRVDDRHRHGLAHRAVAGRVAGVAVLGYTDPDDPPGPEWEVSREPGPAGPDK
jgi:hypothetical protein